MGSARNWTRKSSQIFLLIRSRDYSKGFTELMRNQKDLLALGLE